ncbi:unnamed protein product [Bursaphelenchus xylophilus]|uniref:(pine wood nematode) hypothetical protein n=1 Tax=Bursaphelenchus xylophilus TaxID=6326 RepID=A0A1I7RQU9_BURXY|nr:unnamed protein product [Bursaphelenchus xylophilus]CAG9130683.1 unnamed protein product [Bursaphelenchus xylophilus]
MTSMVSKFIPKAPPLDTVILKKIQGFVDQSKSISFLTGAGISTESGIPDYRSEGVGLYARTKHRPIQYQDLMKNEYWRRKYWSRNYVAWERFNRAKPNVAHYTLAEWEQSQRVNWLITQNVDGLHTDAGSTKLTELHGCGKRVICTECQKISPRSEIQDMITKLNPDWAVKEIGEMRPDGDVDIPDDALINFRIPFCINCGERSILKTNVVFFGENVPMKDVDVCYEKVNSSDLLIVLGSSLSVMSSFRFIHHASIKGIPIIIINIGPTRGDHLAALRLPARVSEVVVKLNI